MKTGFVTLEGRLKREGETDRAGDWDLLISIPSEERYVAVERLLLVLMDLPPLARFRFATKAFKFDRGNPLTLSGAIDALDTPFFPCLPPQEVCPNRENLQIGPLYGDT